MHTWNHKHVLRRKKKLYSRRTTLKLRQRLNVDKSDDRTRRLKSVHSESLRISESSPPLEDAFARAAELVSENATMASAFARVQRQLDLQADEINHRYVIIRPLGAGACGQVFLAYDAELDRKVALKKILRPNRDKELLVHEARLLAKLCHPNIVTVYDIQELPSLTGRLSQYIIMEYVEGCSLREWLAHEPRSQTEILAVLQQAGQGLAAAHVAGIIHRDFKPENVLISESGQARVVDFGLSQTAELTESGEMYETSDDETTTSLTQITGTPAYMAPERYFNSEGSVASDIFSFGITLWEALVGQRPFRGKTIRELQYQIISGQLANPPKQMPRRIARILQRCLAHDPADRWPAMEPLLADLADDPRPRRRRWVAGLALTFTAAVAGSLLAPNNSDSPACEGIEHGFASSWNDDTKTQLRSAVLASDVPYAGDTWERLHTKLDTYANSIRGASKDACEAARVHKRTSSELADRRLACLRARELELDAFVDTLRTGGATAVEHALQASESLTPVSICDAHVLLNERTAPPNSEVAADVEVVRTELTRIKAMDLGGRASEVTELADATMQRAESIGYVPLLAEAQWHRAHLYETNMAFEHAEPAYRKAWWSGLASNHDLIARDAANQLAAIMAMDPSRAADARMWSDNAEAVATRMGVDGDQQIHRLRTLARIAEGQGDYESAVRSRQQATEVATNVFGPNSWKTSAALNYLSFARMHVGDLDGATDAVERGLASGIAALGENHPDLSELYRQQSNIFIEKGEYRAAEVASRRAVELVEAAYGSESRALAPGLYAHGVTLCKLGRGNEGLQKIARALASFLPLGREHLHVMIMQISRADCLRYLERFEEAREIYVDYLAIAQRILGADHDVAVAAHCGLGELALATNDAKAGEHHFRRVLEIGEARAPIDKQTLVPALVGLAEVELMRGRHDQARGHAQRAIELQVATTGTDATLARPRFALARALIHMPGQRGRALQLANLALKGYETAAPANSRAHKNVSAWITRNH